MMTDTELLLLAGAMAVVMPVLAVCAWRECCRLAEHIKNFGGAL